MSRRIAAAVLGICLLTGATACAEEKPSGLPSLSDTKTSEPTPTPTSTPSAATPSAAKTPDSKGHEAFAGRSVAKTAEQKAVAEVWIGFWRMRLNALYAAKVDPDEASKLVKGQALDDLIRYVSQLSNTQLHVVGDMMIGIESISVSGGTATVNSCVNDWTVDMDAKGAPKGKPSLFFQSRGTLVKVAGGWRVSTAQLMSRHPCSA